MRFVREEHSSLLVVAHFAVCLALHQQHWDRHAANHPAGDAAEQQAAQPRVPARGHDDQVDAQDE